MIDKEINTTPEGTITKETQSFQAEIKQLLDLMIHSLYSHREIFLRELISNASDALDKRKFAAISNEALLPANTELEILLDVNPELKVLKIIDAGIGMSYDECKKNLGTIAHSGTKELLRHSKDLKDRPELIGQFGVGFYSAFMVADRVTVHTQKAGTAEGTLWESTGDGSFTISHVPRPEGAGTTLILHLKGPEADADVEDKDSSTQDFTETWTIKGLVKKYSDFIRFPIKMKNDKGEMDVLNSQKALWLKAPSEVKEEEYKEFYKQLSMDWQDPARTLHYRAEGTLEYQALLFFPSKQPWNYMSREKEFGLNLYIKRVFIMNHCQDLIPHYLRFVSGLVDSSDLSLNVSREMLQKDRQVTGIRKSLVNKILNYLNDWLAKDRTSYESFWTEFGSTLKEGIPNDATAKEKLQTLLLFHSTHSEKLTTLTEYVARMPKDEAGVTTQKDIYYLTGENLQILQGSPYLEKVKAKGFEVLFCVDPVDEWVTQSLTEFNGIKLKNITSEDLDLSSTEEKEKIKDQEKEFSALIDSLKLSLGDQIKDVRISDRLTDSPVCLVSAAHDPSAYMQRILQKVGAGEAQAAAKRILEINPQHPIFVKMKSASAETQGRWAEILYNQALLFEGSPVPNPQRFSTLLGDLMLNQTL